MEKEIPILTLSNTSFLPSGRCANPYLVTWPMPHRDPCEFDTAEAVKDFLKREELENPQDALLARVHWFDGEEWNEILRQRLSYRVSLAEFLHSRSCN